MKVVTAEQMNEIDRQAAQMGLSTEKLMENAGRAVAEQVRQHLGQIMGKSILVLVGPGNNGGDGLVAGRYLGDWGADVTFYLLSSRPEDDKNLALVREKEIPVLQAEEDKRLGELDRHLASVHIVIDSVFGTGRSRAISGIFEDALSRVISARNRRPEIQVVAVDMPSGLDANNGAVDTNTPCADLTVTLGMPKPGLYNFPGAEKAGRVIIADIGIPVHLSDDVLTELLTEDWVRTVLPRRPAGAHKGTFGKVMAVAGSVNYIGAAYLACMGAMRSGAGLVTLGVARSLQTALAAKLTENTYLPLPEAAAGVIASEAATVLEKNLPGYNVLLMGCGLGQHPGTVEFIRSALLEKTMTSDMSMVLDADVLNAFSTLPQWWQSLKGNAILTPHPGEMARLTKAEMEEVQQNRLESARGAAAWWKQVVVLKGAYTVIAAPDGRARISPYASARLASAGTGDVLAGIIAGLAAQGLDTFDAAACGVYLHCRTSEAAAEHKGDTGLLASDLLPLLPGVIQKIKQPEEDRFTGPDR